MELLFLLTMTTILLACSFFECVWTLSPPSSKYESVISFGDSLADTGNFFLSSTFKCPVSGKFPYGETFFKHPTGRYSDGRLIVDFIAEEFGLPYLPPYLGIGKGQNIRQGINFAVAGATALDAKYFQDQGYTVVTNDSLGVQLNWFKNIKSLLCTTKEDCDNYFKRALVLVGEIGGNDYNHAFFDGASIKQLLPVVPLVVESIVGAASMLIEEGAVELMIPGNFPIGCWAVYLTYFQSRSITEYDEFGCLKNLNSFSKYHNDHLKNALQNLRRQYPLARIIYGDYYNAALSLIKDPHKFGFSNGGLGVCCGGGGPYNYNSSATCGYAGSSPCKDPSAYINWDGIHLTETAYRHITQSLIRDSINISPREIDNRFASL